MTPPPSSPTSPHQRVPKARDWARFDASVARHAAALTPAEGAGLEEILTLDLVSEYDARHFSAYLVETGLDFTPEFRAMERAWARDEARHHEGFARTLRVGFGWTAERFDALADRRAVFGPIAHLFRDEFTILCLGAYDELATVRAYRANLPAYDRLGPEFGAFLGEVTGDEGWHSSRFLAVLRAKHRHRLAEAPEVVRQIRATEGTPYQQTFVLDHDDSVWSEELFDEVADMLLRRLRPAEALALA